LSSTKSVAARNAVLEVVDAEVGGLAIGHAAQVRGDLALQLVRLVDDARPAARA
jgi:hypothetical protein